MTYKLDITDRAKEDRDRAFDWYCTNYSVELAARWYNGISDAISSLVRNPFLGHQAQESERFPFELYELLYGMRRNKHRVLYTIQGEVISILRIWHSAQQEVTEGDL